METRTDKNKAVVLRFNREVIEQGSAESFKQLMHDEFINRSAPPGTDHGQQGMNYFFNDILRPAISNIAVTIYEQVAEGDLVTTRKNISGTHTGTLLGIEPTGRNISIDVIDIVRIKEEKYFEHWGITNFSDVLTQLKAGS